MTNDKIYQNVPCRGVSHTRSVISLSLRARDQAIMDLKIKRRDGKENVTQKWIFVLSVFITIIPTHLLCQMQANPPDLNSKGPYPSLER